MFERIRAGEDYVLDSQGNNLHVASWRDDFLGALPVPDLQHQPVYKWAADIKRALAMKGFYYSYDETLSKRIFPILVKMFKPRNWASIPANDLT